jgi:hypothetical protein
MPTPKLRTSIALKLHAYGLTQLHDPNWTGMDLFDRVKQHTRGQEEPTTLLFRTIPNGLLYHIGLWLLDDFIINDTYRMSLGGEYRLWYLEDLIEMLASAGVQTDHPSMVEASETVAEISALYHQDEDEYFRAVDQDTTYEHTDRLIQQFEKNIRSILDIYAENYAERVFHDRQLCEHISRTLIAIGFDGSADGSGPAKQWVQRQSGWPTWAVKAVQARDRGQCAQCGTSLHLELAEDEHIDHIVPLAVGGTNDLSNLQLLCAPCNLSKGKQQIDVRSSVPPYLRSAHRLKRRSKDK